MVTQLTLYLSHFFDEMKLSRFLEKDYRKDISDINTLKKVIRKHKPQIIFI